MDTGSTLFWIALGIMLASVAWDVPRPKDIILTSMLYLCGLALADVSFFFKPHLSGFALWMSFGGVTLYGVIFMATLWPLLRRRRARKGLRFRCYHCGLPYDEHEGEGFCDGVSEVQQGQDDGQLPEGAGGQP